MAELTVNIVSAERRVWSGTATAVVAKTPEGEIGVLAGHEPVLALLMEAPLKVTQPDGTILVVAAHGGFFSVANNIVHVIAEVAELAEDIDLARAQEALARAQATAETGDESAIRRAETRITVAGTAKLVASQH